MTEKLATTGATAPAPSYTADQLADLEAIKALCHTYSLRLDRFDVEGVVGVFTEHGTFDASPFGLALMENPDQIRTFFQHNDQAMAHQMHLIANVIITFDGADSAHGTNYLYEDGYTKEGNRVTCLGLNEDRYIRTDAGWRIASRKITPLVPAQLEGY